MGKKLSDWTLRETYKVCLKYEEDCTKCPFYTDACVFGRGPNQWRISGPYTPDSRPRLCSLLGVDVGEAFKFATPYRVYDRVYINDDGTMWAELSTGYTHKVGGQSVCWIVNHPEAVNKLPPKPRLTEQELAICKAIGAKWVTRNSGSYYCVFHTAKPNCHELEGLCVNYSCGVQGYIGSLCCDLFPSVHPGDCVEVPE